MIAVLVHDQPHLEVVSGLLHTANVQFFEWYCLSIARQAGARGSAENFCIAQLSVTTGNMERSSLV